MCVIFLSKNHFTAQPASLSTVRGDFVLQGAEAEDMGRLIKEFWDGLRQRSVYALTRQDTSKPGRHQHWKLGLRHASLLIASNAIHRKKTSSTTPVFSTSSGDTEFLDCKQGDLLLVEKHYSWSASSYTFRATNQRTRSRGLVLKEVLQFLPTLSRPSEQTLVMQVVQENETYHYSQNMEIMKKLYPHIFICIKYKKKYSKKVLMIIRSKKICNNHQNLSVPSSTLCTEMDIKHVQLSVSSYGLWQQLSLTNQELLSSGQKNQSAMRNSRLGEEIIIPVSIKEFASEHFR